MSANEAIVALAFGLIGGIFGAWLQGTIGAQSNPEPSDASATSGDRS
jgi:hypothetical protein